MEKLLERCAALDVHKRQVTACAHVPDRKESALSCGQSLRR